MLSILIPTWNNKSFLQLCVNSIRKHAQVETQIIIHVNDGSDGTLEWVKQEGLDYTHTPENAGVCLAVNLAAKLAKHNYIVFMNDDMYVLPGWDKILMQEIEALNTDCFMLSSTMIEPLDTKNSCVIIGNYGRTVNDFQEQKLLSEFSGLQKQDWSGSTWPPVVVHRKWWEKTGGYSEEFSPGMSSDNDFAMKMWSLGCRVFKGVGRSMVYHFISKSTGRVIKNNGRKQFFNKWGLKQSTFNKYYLRRGEKYIGPLSEPGFSPGLAIQKVLAYFGNWI
jgi:glycosyltransferase involved in cell wall biosynthesis